MVELISTEPATGATLWRGETGDVDAEVSAACAGWSEWAPRPFVNRAETLRRFGNVVRSKSRDFADLIARETGKPLWEAANEVEAVIARVDLSVSAFAERTPQRRTEVPLDGRSAVRHKPHGVLAVIGPHNLPAQLPANHLIPALLAGNAVVFKPSEKTPATGAFLVDCLHEAGVPAGALRLLVGGPAEGRKLAEHGDVDGVLFTGSSRTGLALSRGFAERPGRMLALEMGGNNPILAWDVPDPRVAAMLIVQSAFSTAGQRCTAARRLIVSETLADALLGEIGRLVDRLIVDEPHATPAPFMGPVIDNETADSLGESFFALMTRGGRPLRHLARRDPALPFLTPGIIDMTDATERPDIELFGPILQVVRVSTFEAGIKEANATRFGLCATLLSQDPGRYDQFWANVRAGAVNWNRPTHSIGTHSPFGGLGLSGNFRPTGQYAADYCAYPVASSEADQIRAAIGVGLREETFGA